MNEILINYNGKRIKAFLIARFVLLDDERVVIKNIWGKKRESCIKAQKPCALVFIPHRDALKELKVISLNNCITLCEIKGEDTVHVNEFISPFTAEAPYYNEYKILSFSGLKCIFDYKSFIADVINVLSDKPLEILYNNYPSFLK